MSRTGYQFDGIKRIMLDGEFHTLGELAATTGYPEQSISARIRDLRKRENGGYHVCRRKIAGTLHFEYRVLLFVRREETAQHTESAAA
jgi:hypothetical protein